MVGVVRRYKNYVAQRNTAIIVAVVSIVFSVVVMIGVFYALISGEGDGKIGINAVSEDCSISILDGENNSLLGDVLDFVAPDGRKNIDFEPGSIYYTESFQITNTGGIPVNFRLSISQDESMDMQKFNEGFEIWIAKDVVSFNEPELLTSFTGSLAVGEKSEAYYLIVRMKKEADNEFQNREYKGIGITVYAVQGKAEIKG